jgi:glycosyltransferase involved in cell wall biosynthesis
MIVALDTQLAVGTATGVGVYARDLAAALERDGIAVRRLARPRFDPWRFDRRVIWDQVGLPLALARSGADVLHATSGTMPLLRSRPTVVTVHDMAWQRVQGHTRPYARAYFGALMLAAYRRADAVVVDSAFAGEEYREISGDPRPIDIVSPGVDPRFGGLERAPGPEPFALVVGTVEARKTLADLLDVLVAVPALRIVSVGPFTPYRDVVLERARDLGVADRIELRGYVERAAVDELYRRATLALVPSRYEGFGYAVAEARCAGLPFVAARASSLVEVAGDAGTLIDPADRSGWIDAVRAILSDPEPAWRAAEAARPAALAAFAWERAARALAAIYARLAR